MFHDFLVLDKLAKVGYKVLGNELLYDSHHFPFNHLGWLCPWAEWWWKVRTKVSAIIMIKIRRQTDLSEEICTYMNVAVWRVSIMIVAAFNALQHTIYHWKWSWQELARYYYGYEDDYDDSVAMMVERFFQVDNISIEYKTFWLNTKYLDWV